MDPLDHVVNYLKFGASSLIAGLAVLGGMVLVTLQQGLPMSFVSILSLWFVVLLVLGNLLNYLIMVLFGVVND